MKTDCTIDDPELGPLLIRADRRARRLTFRTKADSIHVTVPPGTTRQELLQALESLRPRLREARRRQARPPIDLNYRIDAEQFHLSLVRGTHHSRFLLHTEPGCVQIACPSETDFSSPQIQTLLRKAVVEALRQQAKRFLPERLRLLSERHGLPFRQVKINTSTTRWGSCSARADINLSCYLMQLPVRLIDYVLLHELSHTREMNHGEHFWALLNSLTDGQAQQLRAAIRQYHTNL